ncbi:radical SAM protein [Candidatus Woesearchaeota archaeon]|nr:radical SAM protein [Candidatus Woesearchaeota archaeon]
MKNFNKLKLVSLNRKLKRIRKVMCSVGIKGNYDYLRLLSGNINKKNNHKKPENTEVLLLSLPNTNQRYPPLGIASIKSHLNENGISCYCIDYNNRFYQRYHNRNKELFSEGNLTFFDKNLFNKFSKSGFYRLMDKWVLEIIKTNPKFLGISITNSTIFFPLRYMVGEIKALNPKIKIIFVGMNSKYHGGEFIKEGYASVVVKGNEEQTFYDVIYALKNKKSLKEIKGIIYKGKNNIIDSGEINTVKDLDISTFPNYDDFNLRRYKFGGVLGLSPNLPMIVGKGCPSRCKFCHIPSTYNNKYGYRSAKNIFEEMRHHKKKYGINYFLFDTQMINAAFFVLEDLCDMIIESKEIFNWSTFFKIFKPNKKGLYDKMARAGCISISVGIESGSEKIRSDMGKPYSDDLIKKEIRLLHEVGIDVHASFIIGYPTEEIEDFNKTVQFIFENRYYLESVFLSTCYLNFGSYLSKNLDKEGIKLDKDGNWYVGTNDIKERVRRLKIIKKECEKIGILQYQSIKDILGEPLNTPTKEVCF